MGKAPASQFYWGDLRRDPEYHMMSWSARGVWIEMLACMHFSSERGKLEGSPEQIARMIGCTNGDFDNAVKEISVTKTGDVTESNGIVTIINRRMFREERERKLTRCRVQRFRNAKEKHESNVNVTPPSSSSSSSPTPKKRNILSDDEFLKSLKEKFTWVDFEREMAKIDAWLLANPGRQKTRRFIVKWISKVEKPMGITAKQMPAFKENRDPIPELRDAIRKGWK